MHLYLPALRRPSIEEREVIKVLVCGVIERQVMRQGKLHRKEGDTYRFIWLPTTMDRNSFTTRSTNVKHEGISTGPHA
jgi:hypothetical protein